ncbi:DUF4238 domain-containing protein [Bacillus sp. AFS088145]|uniref:DUF4238 domain-containing protein n=1 Tax=Bacillus sp. AFS088145 TaxID=2033514 RepID=UPI000BF83E6A|nr:DUF4238 domain-containing protein [Bacillus sp. AFS088145]PFH86464.1 hypothetical protein COI44_12655 [Bacillus sp. AFS088145]
MNGKAKYHHLIPRTYLQSWCFSNDSLHAYSKSDLTKKKQLNINNHFGIQNYHTIKVGMPICTDEDLKKIFQSLNGYKVEYEGKLLQSLKEYNQYFYDFDEWKIYYAKTESIVPKKKKNTIKSEINQCRIVDIEEAWSRQYENGWNSLKQIIEQKLLTTNALEIDAFNKEELMKFIVSLDWRSEKGNEELEKILEFINKLLPLKEIDLSKDDRSIAFETNAYEWSKRNYLLKEFNEFLQGKGIINDQVNSYIRDCTLEFFIANGNVGFLTSDNPSFIYHFNDGLSHVMPLTPKILVRVLKGSTDKYFIKLLNDELVQWFNGIIIENSNELALSNKPSIQYGVEVLQKSK